MIFHFITPDSEIIEDEGNMFLNFTIKTQDDYLMFAVVVINYGFVFTIDLLR